MIRRALGTLIGLALILWIASCEPARTSCPVLPDAGPCLVGDVPGALYAGPLKTGRRPCWTVAGELVCPREAPAGGVQVGEFATADGWAMIDDHAARWNAIRADVEACAR